MRKRSQKQVLLLTLLTITVVLAIFTPLAWWIRGTFDDHEKWLIQLGVFVGLIVVGLTASFLMRRNSKNKGPENRP